MPCKGTTWDCIAQHVNSHVQAIAWEFTWFHHVLFLKHPESLRKRLTPPQATFKTASENETSSYLIVTVYLSHGFDLHSLGTQSSRCKSTWSWKYLKIHQPYQSQAISCQKCMSQRTSESSPNFLQSLLGAQLVLWSPWPALEWAFRVTGCWGGGLCAGPETPETQRRSMLKQNRWHGRFVPWVTNLDL